MAKVELDIRAQIANLNKGLNKTQGQLKQLQGQSNRTSKTMQTNMNKTSAVATKLGGALAAVFSIGAAIRLGKAIFNVTAEFQKFRAVLTNTLGSAKEANRELAKIQEFAAQTPFSVRELTDSFVRLVNQGFKPTAEQMRKLGDLAASTGKEFIQLTEAIIDAQTGEFERLKEFGIRASKEGDNVTFTFKEVQTQVEFTASAIQDFILSLGDLEGVSGAMEAISVTLGGAVSNLGDSWEALLVTMGEKSSGTFHGVINFLSDILGKLKGVVEEFNPQTGAIAAFDTLRETLNKIAEEDRLEFLNDQLAQLRVNYADMFFKVKNFTAATAEEQKFNRETRDTLAVLIPLYEELQKQITTGTDDLDRKNEVVENEIETIETLQKELKGYQDDLKNINILDETAIANKNREIQTIKELIEYLTKLGQARASAIEVEERPLGGIEDDSFAEDQLGFFDWINEERRKKNEEIDQQILRDTKDRVDKDLQIQLAGEEAVKQAKIASANYTFDILSALSKDNAEAQQVINIAQAIMNGALGITKTGAQLGYPAAIPFQIALGLQTLAQIATIRAQKFAGGHYDVLKGRRHAQGGVDIGIGEAEQGEGVAVFSRQATAKYGKFLPAFVKAINENKADVTDGNAYSFNFNDSQSVSELKGIRELLSKAEIRYENGYRIEIRKGQTTKVKC